MQKVYIAFKSKIFLYSKLTCELAFDNIYKYMILDLYFYACDCENDSASVPLTY